MSLWKTNTQHLDFRSKFWDSILPTMSTPPPNINSNFMEPKLVNLTSHLNSKSYNKGSSIYMFLTFFLFLLNVWDLFHSTTSKTMKDRWLGSIIDWLVCIFSIYILSFTTFTFSYSKMLLLSWFFTTFSNYLLQYQVIRDLDTLNKLRSSNPDYCIWKKYDWEGRTYLVYPTCSSMEISH